MAQLSERDLALLSTLMYCNYVVQQPEGTHLSKIVSDLKKMSDAKIWDTRLTGEFGNIYETVTKEKGEEAGIKAAVDAP